jgi:predicted CoA-binding protein
MLLTRLPEIREALASARTIAVLGAHHEPQRAACYVPDYLQRAGYRVLPVNPKLTHLTLFGEPVVARLSDLTTPVDLVDVFRAPRWLPSHLPDTLAMSPRPRTIWLQLGVVHAAFSRALVDAGFDVVEDRCTLADHRLFSLPTRAC